MCRPFPSSPQSVYRLSADASLPVDYAFWAAFAARTAAHLARAAAAMRLRPAALILRFVAFSGLPALAWILAQRAWSCSNAGAGRRAHLTPAGRSLRGFGTAAAAGFDSRPPRSLSSRNPPAPGSTHLPPRAGSFRRLGRTQDGGKLPLQIQNFLLDISCSPE